ncbi:MAG: lasso peptide biosynthesis B2 protein [Acidobacteria bacterium]|nr:lasso peptide biosynthesis B2 protein [Acidobacteriota bacterium]
MIRSLRKWLRLPANERRRVRRAAAALVRVKLFRRASSIQRRSRAPGGGDRPQNHQTLAGHDLSIARDAAASVERAARGLPFSTSCLDRSAALLDLLRREGLEGDLRIGVRRGLEGVEAHAWVELNGEVLNDSADVHQRYSAFQGTVLPSRLELR